MEREVLKKVRDDLKSYRRVQKSIPAWEKEIARLQHECDDVRISSPTLSGVPCAARDSSSIVERQALRHERLQARMKDITLDLKDARLLLWRFDNALSVLNDFDRGILSGHYINGTSWVLIADKFGYSEACIRVYGRRALAKLARLLFRPSLITSTMESADDGERDA